MIKYAESLQPPELSIQSGNGPRGSKNKEKNVFSNFTSSSFEEQFLSFSSNIL